MASDLRKHTITFFGVGILAALAASFGYYVVAYKASRADYFAESRRRQLGILAEQIEGAIDNRRSSLRNAVDYARSVKADGWPTLLEQLRLAGLRDPSCDREHAATETAPVTAAPTDNIVARETSPLDFSSDTAGETTTQKRDARLEFCYDPPSRAADASTSLGTCEGKIICATVTLGALMSPFLLGDGFGLGNVFIARGGEVLFESGGNDVRLGTLLDGAARAEAKSGDKATPTPAGQAGPFPSLAELQSASLVREVAVAGRPYRLFSHPLHLSSEQQAWSLGFLVDRERFDYQVAALSYGSLSYVPLLLGIALLSAKLLKLRTMGGRERLTAADVRLLAFSLLALAGTLTTLGLAGYENYRLQRALDEELASVAQRIEKNVAEEWAAATAGLGVFVRAYAQERAFDANRLMETGIFDACTSATPGDSCPVFNCPLRTCADPSCPAAAVVGSLRTTYPFFDLVIRSDPAGLQMEKWSVGDTATPLILLDNASNQRDARLGRLRDGADATGVAMHLRLSPNTGNLVPALSTPILGPTEGDEVRDFRGSSTLVPELSSLLRPALPAGFAFAVLESDGRVVAHSILSRSLYENFFEECSAAGRIRSLIESRGVGVVSGSYRGRAQTFHVSPMPSSPWTLLVFRDREVPRTLLLDALVTWFAVYGLYMGVAFLGVTLLRWLVPHDGARWIWPDGESADAYATCLLALVITLLLFLAAIIRRPSSSLALLGVSLALPLAAASHVYLRLSSSSRRDRRPRRPGIAAVAFGVAALIAICTSGGDRLVLAIDGAAIAVLVALAMPGAESVGARRPRMLWLLVAFAAAAGAWWGYSVGRFIAAALYALIALGSLRIAAARQKDGNGFAWQQFYACGGVALVILIGVLPAASFFEDVWDETLEVLVRHGQLKTAEILDRRHARISEDYEMRATTGSAPARRSNLTALRAERLAKTWDIVPSDFFGKEVESCSIPPVEPTGASERARRIAGTHFSGLVSHALLVYHDESIEMRELLDSRAADGRWRWKMQTGDDGASEAELCWRRPAAWGGGSDVSLRAPWPPPLIDRGSPWLMASLATLLLALLVGWYLIVRWLMRCIFGVGALQIIPLPESGAPHFGRGILLLRRAGVSEDWDCKRDVERLGVDWDADVHVLDLRTRPSGWDVRDSISAKARVVLVKHLEERLEDLPSLEATLKLLEALVFRQKRNRGDEYLVVVVTTVKPIAYLRRRLQSNADVEADRFIRPEVIGRWARLLERLEYVDADEVSPSRPDLTRKQESLHLLELVAWFLAVRPDDLYRAYAGTARFGLYEPETTQTPRLRGIAWEILWQRQVSQWRTAGVPAAEVKALLGSGEAALRERHALAGLESDTDREKVEAILADATQAHYRAMWSQLTDDEQLTLVQLAKEGYVNPHGWHLVNDLMRRGMVRFTPAIRPMNDSFRRFAASEETEIQVRRWETADGRSAWDRTRSVILLMLIGGGLVLYATQPERLTQLVSVIGALGAAAVTVANMFGLFGAGRTAPPAAKP